MDRFVWRLFYFALLISSIQSQLSFQNGADDFFEELGFTRQRPPTTTSTTTASTTTTSSTKHWKAREISQNTNYDVYFLVDFAAFSREDCEHVAHFLNRAANDVASDGASVVGLVVGDSTFVKTNSLSGGRLSDNRVTALKNWPSVEQLLSSEDFSRIRSNISTIPLAMESLSRHLLTALSTSPSSKKKPIIAIIITGAQLQFEDFGKLSNSLDVLWQGFSARFVALLVGDLPIVEPYDDIVEAPCLVLRYSTADTLLTHTPRDGAKHLLGNITPLILDYSLDNNAEYTSICLELALRNGFDQSTQHQRFNLADPVYYYYKFTTTISPSTTTTTTTPPPTTTTTTTTTTTSTTTTTTPTTTTTTTTPVPTTTTTTTPSTTTTPTTTITTTTTTEPTTSTTTTTTQPTTTTTEEPVSEYDLGTNLTTTKLPDEDYASSEEEEEEKEEETTTPSTTTHYYETVTSNLHMTRHHELVCYQCHGCSQKLSDDQQHSTVKCGNGTLASRKHSFCYVIRRGNSYERGCNSRADFQCISFDTGAFAQYCCHSNNLCNDIIPPKPQPSSTSSSAQILPQLTKRYAFLFVSLIYFLL